MAFATGRDAFSICDRCGWRYKYVEIKEEWNGLRTCPECYEAKHPKLFPIRSVDDPQGLQFSRPARTEPMVQFVGGAGETGKIKKTLSFKIELGKATVSVS